ncbi:MAG: hypothetical protein VZQ80_07855 [Lachnospiraceae bacterium]|nr:hypothetical protein [Lachnospiraceae bacterium]
MKNKSLTRRIWANAAHTRALQNLPNEKQVAHAADSDKCRPYRGLAEAPKCKSSRPRGGFGQMPPIREGNVKQKFLRMGGICTKLLPLRLAFLF